MNGTIDWDEPLPQTKMPEWNTWTSGLLQLGQVHIARCYSPESLSQAASVELHTFCDASEFAIAAVSYLLIESMEGRQHVSFALGKTKVAPTSGHTIPRLELCAAVLAVQISKIVKDSVEINFQKEYYYSDSKIVLGYINNTTRRFLTYVSKRVEKIRKTSHPHQWKYVSTQSNPADIGTRGVHADKLQDSPWLTGLPFFRRTQDNEDCNDFPLVNPDTDTEIKKNIKTLKTTCNAVDTVLGQERFKKFSSWSRLVMSIAYLKHIAETFSSSKTQSSECKEWHSCTVPKTVENFRNSEKLIIREVQKKTFKSELESLRETQLLAKDSSIRQLDPYIDEDHILRVGGRLNKSLLSSREKNPIIISGKDHVATLLVRHFHAEVQHQGRHFTEGAVRAAGYWITGGKRLVSSIIHNCIICRKHRGGLQEQKMADLPTDRLQEAPPFTFVGVDTFGPWNVVTRKTRGGQANSKRWAIIFTCLAVRAVHLELIDEMSSSAFINALRRFIGIRGKVTEFRSDRGTNFVGATDNIRADAVNVESDEVKNYLFNSGVTWKFNPPHSSHMGGVWERMIGLVRRILESMLSSASTNITHDVLSTFMAEVSSIINSRPLVPVSWDSEIPDILTPNTILTHKTDIDSLPCGELDAKDMYRHQWKRVQHLANVFWNRWRKEYLQSLQPRRKWTITRRNVTKGDLVLVKDKQTVRSFWPVGLVIETFPSDDGMVRKVKVKMCREGKTFVYIRPIVDLVLLIANDE